MFRPTSGKRRREKPSFESRSSRLSWNSALVSGTYVNPFTGECMSVREVIELCGFWRRLIDKNCELGGGLGFAFWKQDNVGALMWGGAAPFQFLRTASEICSGEASVAVWRSKVPPAALAELEEQGRPLVEVEDGFLRSQGLGADCVPPLSITVDGAGAHFDPARPSELEALLQNGVFDQPLINRARRLRRLIVDAGLSKYSRGDVELNRRCEGRRHILVPGQVEDDRSVQTEGADLPQTSTCSSGFESRRPTPTFSTSRIQTWLRDTERERSPTGSVFNMPMKSLPTRRFHRSLRWWTKSM